MPEWVTGLYRFRPNSTHLVVDVTIEAVTADKVYYNPCGFRVKDSDGVEASASAYTNPGGLEDGYVEKGDKVRGKVEFEMKPKPGDLTLHYTHIDGIRVTLKPESAAPTAEAPARSSVTDLASARAFVVGTWTYTSPETHLGWTKFVVQEDGTMLEYSASNRRRLGDTHDLRMENHDGQVHRHRRTLLRFDLEYRLRRQESHHR